MFVFVFVFVFVFAFGPRVGVGFRWELASAHIGVHPMHTWLQPMHTGLPPYAHRVAGLPACGAVTALTPLT